MEQRENTRGISMPKNMTTLGRAIQHLLGITLHRLKAQRLHRQDGNISSSDVPAWLRDDIGLPTEAKSALDAKDKLSLWKELR